MHTIKEVFMIKKYEFIDRTLFLIRKLLADNLVDESTLDEMVIERNKLLKAFTKEK
jgi:hypothetical protein